MKDLAIYLVFPGLFFGISIGLLACWVERKVSARLQWRVGPPWYQSFVDIVKLFGKETILPKTARLTFIFAPYLGLACLGLAVGIIAKSLVSPNGSFPGDIIVLVYLLTMPAVALIIGASASANPLASVGASREMKLLVAYELPFLLSIIAVIIKCKGMLQLGNIISWQSVAGSNIASLSGITAFFAMIFCMQAKLGLAPFEISEADQEIMSGVLLEYSGPLLAIFKLVRALMFYTMPLFIIALFMGKDTGVLFLVLKYLALLTAAIVIKNTNPRLRIDQAMRFFWRLPTVLGGIAVILATLGL